MYFRRFAPYLPEWVELAAVQYPGHEDRYCEERLRRMDKLVEHIAADLVGYLDKPTVFFGHSMGALVAYEVAQTLKQRLRWEPQLLIVSGSASPEDEKSYSRCKWNTTEDELITEMRRLGGTPLSILEDHQIMKSLLPVVRADYEILDHYNSTSGRPLSCPVIFVAGTSDSSVSEYTAAKWRGHTSGVFHQHWLDGGHFYLCSDISDTALLLSKWLEENRCQSLGALL